MQQLKHQISRSLNRGLSYKILQ